MQPSRQSGVPSVSASGTQLFVQVGDASLQSVVAHQPSPSASVQLTLQCALFGAQSPPHVCPAIAPHVVQSTYPSPSGSEQGVPIVMVRGSVSWIFHHPKTTYVWPTVNRWDYDLKKMMNPNLPTGYGPGGGVDVLPAMTSVFTGIRNAFRDREAEATRRQIQDELRQINEQRRAAGLPPIEETPTVPARQQPDQP